MLNVTFPLVDKGFWLTAGLPWPSAWHRIEDMFEGDLTTLSTPDLLESAAGHRAEANRLDARLLEHAQTYADRHHPDALPGPPRARAWLGDGRERAVVLGGDGCPEIAEFAPAEFGVMLGISAGAAADFIGQALALRHRFPLTWARVQAGEATPWKARKIATACLELPEDAARSVDRRVAKVVDSLTPIRLDKIVEAAKKHADPEGSRRKAEEKARERGVYLGRSDEHGTKKIYIRTATGAAVRFDARITSIAEALKALGDTNTLQRRRAEAVGIIADPRYTEELLHQAREFQNTQNTQPAPPDTTTDDATHQATATADDDATHQATAAADDGTQHGAATATTDDGRQSANATHGGGTDRGAFRAAPAASGRDATPGAGATRSDNNSSHPASARDNASTTAPVRGTDRSQRPPGGTDGGADRSVRPLGGAGGGAYSECEDLLGDWVEPGLDAEADRDAPRPSDTEHPDPLDTPVNDVVEPFDPDLRLDTDDGEPLDAEARRALDARLAQIRHDAHTNPRSGRRLRPGQTEIYVHLTDHTLAAATATATATGTGTGTGTGVLRVEDHGPLLASQLAELIGHGPYTVKPVIDLRDAVSVDAYEIPDRIRERVKLTHPVEVFPYGTRETHAAMDLDHIQPYDPLGPSGQTTPANLAPLRRFPHRVKTHGRWKVRRLDHTTVEWITPNGFAFHVDPTGTHRVPKPQPDA